MFSWAFFKGHTWYESVSHSVISNSLQPHVLYSPTGSSVHGDSPGKENWSGLPFPSPGDLANPRIQPGPLALQADSLPSEPPGKPIHSMIYMIIQVMLEKNCTLSIKTETAHIKYELSHKSKKYN